MMKWTRTSRLSTKNSLSSGRDVENEAVSPAAAADALALGCAPRPFLMSEVPLCQNLAVTLFYVPCSLNSSYARLGTATALLMIRWTGLAVERIWHI